ncbi:MAG: hypothetical protein QOE31_1942, partial [Solirubrobacteraceae bacterium]|nr:hypothetical protein [Solirubrobacteraceae bacterium]
MRSRRLAVVLLLAAGLLAAGALLATGAWLATGPAGAAAATHAAVATHATGAAGATRGLALGFFDPVFSTSSPDRATWLQRAADSAADIVRIDVGWVAVAPDARTRPAGFHARDPGDPAYTFS